MVCGDGMYLSTAILNDDFKISVKNKVKLHDEKVIQFQLIMFEDDIGAIIMHRMYEVYFQEEFGAVIITFQVVEDGKLIAIELIEFTDNNPIKIMHTTRMESRWFVRIAPLIRDKHVHFFNGSSKLVDFDYLNNAIKVDNDQLIPEIKLRSQGAWFNDKFYFLSRECLLSYKFGVFNFNERQFTILILPASIPDEWSKWWVGLWLVLIEFRLTGHYPFHPFMVIDERGILSILPMNVEEDNLCFYRHSSMRTIQDKQPSQMKLFRIALKWVYLCVNDVRFRVPETLLNLSCFAVIKNPAVNKKSVQQTIDNLLKWVIVVCYSCKFTYSHSVITCYLLGLISLYSFYLLLVEQ